MPRNTIMQSANRTKRALLIRNASSYDFGGAERFVVALAQELIANGWEATIVTAHSKIRELATSKAIPSRHGWWWSRQDWSGRRIALTPLYILWQLVLVVYYLILFIRLRPDVIHPQSKDDFIAATVAGKLLGKRVIWTDHADLKYVYQNVPVWYKNPVGKLVYLCSRIADHITLVSKSEEKLIESALGHELSAKHQVIYNGILDYSPPSHQRQPADKNALIFCCTSRLVTAKGIGELIRAFQILQNDHDNLRLWILGEGPEADKFHTMASNNPNITFWGFPDDSLGILQAADVFVHPSYHEGFSLSIIEAAMLQKPIIACNVGGNPEIIIDGKTGLLAPAKDAHKLARAMERLIGNPPLRKSLAKAARKSYEHNFQFDNIVKEQFIPLYED